MDSRSLLNVAVSLNSFAFCLTESKSIDQTWVD
jgi:hypothetical protein